MNKYQKFIFDEKQLHEKYFIFYPCFLKGQEINNDLFVSCLKYPPTRIKEKLDKLKPYGCFDLDTDTYTITQDEDITLTEYVIAVKLEVNELLSGVQAYKNGTWQKVELKPHGNGALYFIPLDFVNKTEKVKFSFVNNLADDYELSIKYVEADKQAYEERQKQLAAEAVAKKVNARYTAGSDLVNIYFQPCNDLYARAEIELFVPGETKTELVGGPYGTVNKTTVLTWNVIKKCKVSEDEFYLSVTGLAYGKYAFILKQFDSSNVIIYKTDYIEFEIKKPSKPIQEFGQLNVI